MNERKLEIEQAMRAASRAGDLHSAAELALRCYGSEVLNFQTARLRSSSAGAGAFVLFAEDLAQAVSDLEFRCGVRAWLYCLARRAADRRERCPEPAREPRLTLALQASVLLVLHGGRTEPSEFDHAAGSPHRALQQALSVEDQTLLILHVDRGLSWHELAIVMHADGAQLTGVPLIAESTRLYHRFLSLKTSLRRTAVAQGLLKQRRGRLAAESESEAR